MSTNDGGIASSYLLVVRPSKLYFVFNEHIRNLEPFEGASYVTDMRKLRNYRLSDKKGCLALATVDLNGQVDKQMLVSNQELAFVAFPKGSWQITPDQAMIMLGRKKYTQYGLLTFE